MKSEYYCKIALPPTASTEKFFWFWANDATSLNPADKKQKLARGYQSISYNYCMSIIIIVILFLYQ